MTASLPIDSRLLFRNDDSTPLGRLTAAGFIDDSRGVGPDPRVLGHYAIVYLLNGRGRYTDSAGLARQVEAGDLIVLFPEIPHTYGPSSGERWAEFYVVFDGPVFDLYRRAGLLSPARPIHRLAPVDRWLTRLEDAVGRSRPRTLTDRTVGIGRFLGTLTEMLAPSAEEPLTVSTPAWVQRACELLEARLSENIEPTDIAAALSLPYETFRKRFQRAVGVSPVRYRAIRKIDAACAMLQSPDLPAREVAARLGFSDEYHFSRRFKQIVGVSPREFRRRLPDMQPTPPYLQEQP